MSTAGRRALLAHTLLLQAVVFVLRPAATYQALRLDVSDAWIGALGAGFALVPLLVAVRVGRAVDRAGERVIMIGGAALVVAAAVVFVLLSHQLAGLCLAVVLLGTGHLLATVGQHSAVANSSAREDMDRSFGRYTFMVSLGQAVGPALILLTDGSSAIPDTGAIFVVGLAGSVLCLLVTLLTRSGPQRTRASRDARAGTAWAQLRTPGVRAALVISTVVVAAIDILVVYLPVVAAGRGVSAGAVGLLLSCRAGAAMLTRLGLGALARVTTRSQLLVASVAAIGLGFVLLALPLPLGWAFAGVALVGFGTGASQPLTLAWVAAATAEGFRGRMMSLRLTGNRLGQVLLPASGGLLVAGAGSAAVLWATALLVVAMGPAARMAPP